MNAATPTYTYDPNQVIVIVGGIPLAGHSEGSKVKASRSVEAYVTSVGVDGEVSRARQHNRMGSIEISLAQTSASNDVLSGFAIADEIDNSGIVPIAITDIGGRSTFVAAKGWVKKWPDATFEKEVKERVWIIECSVMNFFEGGSAPA